MFERTLVGIDRVRRGQLIRMNDQGVAPGDDGVISYDVRWPDGAVALGYWNGEPIAVAMDDQPEAAAWMSAREWLGQLPVVQTEVLSTALQVMTWRRDHRYCGRCGSAMRRKQTEFAMVCPSCRLTSFPRISPCIITLVTHGRDLLLARSPRFAPGRFSTLAGFIEAGESVEAAVRREVMEEVGVSIGRVRYFKSQSWPFPHSLMMGFYAEAASRDITIDGVEIEAADWFSPEYLPGLPPSFSIAHSLIDNFLKGVAPSG
ncbi:NAD(+) diphosphatase [Larsenimonas rhizosphaerae]|uniref:NAD(+) diphosphatase n=1 Tax=Larsenimonas rhizosphaerae TaxID=2944682 RepID=A0AA41ZDY6_9GAMM|nr:NAD(+) diphosphatase [Larsenimonas rhizosphaerae]MCM2130820.1 NAD(+) diphosphatase [Larsenimonas rhizosphaerae]MCX2523524.1 NAD(+) diphosphatase [Larsenimonas rhizosphaerae]